MKRVIHLFIFLLFSAAVIYPQTNQVHYKFQVKIPASGIEVLEESSFPEGGGFSIPDVAFNHPPFNELYEAVKGGIFSLDQNSIQRDLYMEITLEGLNPLTGNLYDIFGEPLFLNMKIDVWELPDNYAGTFPPDFNPTSPFYFNPATGLTFKINKTNAFYAFLSQVGIDAEDDLGYAFITTTSFNGNDLTINDQPGFVSFKTNHLSKFGGGRGQIHDVVIENQTIILSPAKGYLSNNSNAKLKIFFSPTDSLILEWDRFVTDPNMRFKMGSSSGSYDLSEIPVSGNRAAFIPGGAPHNLSTGRYYGIMTNSSKNTFDEIEADYNNDPAGIEFSNEIQFIIEAQNAPVPTSPRGEINDATPIFQWDAIPGVPAYWLIVSSTPFTVVSLPSGDVSVQGANILWNYITDQTTVQYGEKNSSSPYNEDAQPLLNGNEYNYTLLNLYDKEDISFASTVFSGAFAFTYSTQNNLDSPILVEPLDSAEFISEREITFKWDPVPNANNYTIYLYQRVQSFAGNDQQIDLPIWNSTTTNTSLTYPALTSLTNGNYVWNIMATDAEGNGALSKTYIFNYSIEMGSFRVEALSTETSENLLGFNVEANAVSGGVSPANPFIVTNSTSYVDSLVVGTYQFVATKTGFFDTTVTASVNANSRVNVVFRLRPFPSIVSGIVKDNNGDIVSGATVKFKNLLTLNTSNVSSGFDGTFSLTVPKGTYSVKVTKPGYLASSTINISPDDNQFTLSAPLIITLDNATISGQVVNDEGKPIQLGSVKAIQGDDVREKTTNEAGAFSFNLNSGAWVIKVSKSGFISPDPVTYNLAAGDNKVNQKFTLVPRANQVSGFVYKVIGGSGTTPFENITVTATPNAGAPQTAETNSSGSYSLSLKSGSYTISINKNGYSSSDPVNLTLNIAESISDINFTLTPNPSTVKGKVTSSDGSALGDVIVSNGTASASTLPNGTYSLSVSSGSMTLTVAKESFISPDPQSISVSPGQTLTGINFELVPNAGTISGKVISLNQPLAGAVITAQSSSQTLTATAGNDGNYSISVKPGTWSISASKSGFVTSDVSQAVVGPGQQSINNNFNLVQNTATISGTASGASGPISGAQITVTELNTSNSKNSVSNINGNFAVTVTAGKSYSVVISKTGFGDFTKTTATLSPQSSTTINAELSANPSSVSGKVFDNRQEPITDASVKIFRVSDGNEISEKSTSFDGSYTFGLSAGSYKITATKPGYVSDSLNVSLNVGENPENINFNLTENFAVITGTVKDVADNPVSGTTINLTGTAGGATATSDDNGSYIISRLVGDTFQITYTAAGHSDSTITGYTISDGETKKLDMVLFKLNGRVYGSIKDNNGNVVPDASVNLSGISKEYNTQSDADGNFDITSVSYGTYKLTAIRSGYTLTDTTTLTLTKNAPEVNSDFTSLLLNNSTISGTVKDDEGNNISGVTITVQGSIGAGNAQSDNTGKYEITSLAPGDYTISASKENYSPVTQDVSVNGTLTADLTLTKNKATIKGTVKDQLNNTLSFLPDVVAISSNGQTFNTSANPSGDFEFDEVAENADYTIYTNVYKEGYINDTTTINIPQGTTLAGPVNLLITINNSYISGTTGIGEAAITFLNKSNNQSKILTSSSSGNYEIKFVPAGDYRITPSKLGYSFSPASKDVTLSINDSTSVDFSATANTGTVLVTTKLADNSPISQVNISIVSNDTSKIFTSSSNAQGIAQFNDVPSDSYVITASKEGYSASPPSTSKTVTTGQSVTVNFVMTKNTAQLSGMVLRKDNGPVTGATVKLIYKSSGQSVFTTSDNGNYSFAALQSGDALLIADKVGFAADTLDISLTPGANLTGRNLTLTPTIVNLTGKVVYLGQGVEGVNITVSSTNIFNQETDANGNFNFADMPVKTGINDTTIFDVRINDPDYLSLGEFIEVASDQAGQTIQLADFILPSGSIVLTFTDGVDVLPGVEINFTKPNGQTISTTTGSKGRFKTGLELKKGVYKLSATKENYLTPDNNYLTVNLTSDTALVNRNILMPYSITPIDSMLADEPVKFVISYRNTQSNSSGKLYYKKSSANLFTSLDLTNTGSSFEASIPAQFSLEDIVYYAEIFNADDSVNYRSVNYTVTPIAKGLLTYINISPELDNAILRIDDGYQISIGVRDGLNNDMTDRFTGSSAEGNIFWTTDNPEAFDFNYPDAADSTQLIISTKSVGDFRMKVTVKLNGFSLSKSFSFTVSDIPLKSITVTSPAERLSNRSSGIQFNYSAADTLNRSVLLGNSTTWSVSPSNAGMISSTGFFTPSDTNYIGNPQASLADDITGIEGTKQITVFATVPPNITYSVTDGMGMTLRIAPGTLTFPIELSISQGDVGVSKKIYTPLGKDISFSVANQLYNIKYQSNITFPGDSLSVPAELTLPLEQSLKLFNGKKSIGRYDPIKKIWVLLPISSDGAASVSTASFRKFNVGHAVLTENEPLGLKHVSVLPSPFSPYVAPLKIGYFLTSQDRFATVTIKIYNIRGELIRTVLENELQTPGRYGSKSSLKEITWDGTTDSGRNARNGRYIIKIDASDSSGSESKLVQVILIK